MRNVKKIGQHLYQMSAVKTLPDLVKNEDNVAQISILPSQAMDTLGKCTQNILLYA